MWRSTAAGWLRFFARTRVAPFHPTVLPLAQAACQLARVGPKDIIYDLGSGDGPILICALSEFKCHSAVGYELDERLIDASIDKAKAAGVSDRLQIRRADLLKADLTPASVITMYLSDRANEALEPAIIAKLTAEPSTRIISLMFPMPRLTPTRREMVSGFPMYLFTGTPKFGPLPDDVR